MNSTFIYALSDPISGEVRYVGKANNPKMRLNGHIQRSENPKTHCHCWIKSLLINKTRPNLIILEEVNVAIWGEREDYWISQFPNLTNKIDGGKFCPMLVPEIVEKYKNTLKENPRFFSESTRKKLSAHAKNLWESGLLTGTPCSEQRRERVTVSMKKHWTERSDEIKIKMQKQSSLVCSKPVAKCDDQGNVLHKYRNVKEAEIELFGKNKGHISRAIKRNGKAKGFNWKYL